MAILVLHKQFYIRLMGTLGQAMVLGYQKLLVRIPTSGNAQMNIY